VQSDHAKSKNREESRIACLVDRAKQSCPVETNPNTKTLTATSAVCDERMAADVFKGDAMQAIHFRNQLQRKARERAQRISEARKAWKRERLHDMANIFESAFNS
jgi:hypothetical protein